MNPPSAPLLKVAQPMATWLTIGAMLVSGLGYFFTRMEDIKTSIVDQAQLKQRMDDQDKHYVELRVDIAQLKTEIEILLQQQRADASRDSGSFHQGRR
jgi:cell division protein FtsB